MGKTTISKTKICHENRMMTLIRRPEAKQNQKIAIKPSAFFLYLTFSNIPEFKCQKYTTTLKIF